MDRTAKSQRPKIDPDASFDELLLFVAEANVEDLRNIIEHPNVTNSPEGVSLAILDQICERLPNEVFASPAVEFLSMAGADDIEFLNLIECIASHKKSSEDTMWRIFALGIPPINGSLCSNPSVPVKLLERIAEDERLWPEVASSVVISADLAKKLSRSNDLLVVSNLLSNPSCPGSIIKLFSEGMATQEVFRVAIASNPKIPSDLANRYSKDASASVRYRLATNMGVPTNALFSLRDDPEGHVSRAAKAQLLRRG